MWAVGVILLCCCSRTYPFFRAPDDISALAEISCLFGTEAVREAARQYGKRLLVSEARQACDLRQLCRRLAYRRGSDFEVDDVASTAPDIIQSLLYGLLQLSAASRLTAKQALALNVFVDVTDNPSDLPAPIMARDNVDNGLPV